MLTRDQLLLLGRRYAEATRCSLYTVGMRAAGHNTLFVQLASGRDCRAKTLENATRWLACNWPPDAPWPPGLPDRLWLLMPEEAARFASIAIGAC